MVAGHPLSFKLRQEGKEKKKWKGQHSGFSTQVKKAVGLKKRKERNRGRRWSLSLTRSPEKRPEGRSLPVVANIESGVAWKKRN